ncbi:MAG: hypothetical protein M1355_02745 [Patescibacteria group bacterium]|nr:hypothetical protein [Patescibacteria group bacterium]
MKTTKTKSIEENLFEKPKEKSNIERAEEYLKENIRLYQLDTLRWALLDQGYSKKDIDEAVKRLNLPAQAFGKSELDIGFLLSNSWNFFSNNFAKLFLLYGISIVPGLILENINYADFRYLETIQTEGYSIHPEEIFSAFKFLLLPYNIILIILSIFAAILAITSLYKAIIDTDQGQSLQIGRTYKESFKFILPLILIQILVGLSIIGGIFLLIVPALIFGIWYSFAPFILFSENLRGRAALRRSHDLVRGRWWGVFGRIILASLLVGAISLPFSALALIPRVGNILNSLLQVATTIFITTYSYFLYKGLKSTKQ